MEASQVWKLFEKTGNVGVYILYKRLSEQQDSVVQREDSKTYADSDRGNRN
ncbi:MAG: YqzL family protein [Oscillospiraceae bacterium]|nr:YqzL family protein [Oscillospiraceae bacterium]